ncbi:hypothetical protein ACIQNG_26215 [Streptomyces sp. NPDC091377]|uniref:hypothetical protein n=1 Tax=Streptomyces sp. NPDC091377 TaxID=3365995 RepID=UPI0037F9F7F2
MPAFVGGLTGVTRIAACGDHNVALVGEPGASGNTVRACGYNASGQLSNGTTTDSTTPVTPLTALTGIDKIAAPVGGDFSMAN